MKKSILAVLIAVSAFSASCSKLDLAAEKFCFDFIDRNGNVASQKCDMTEAEAERYRKAGNFWGYQKR